MRVNWQQSLEGCSLLEIRNILRALAWADASFSTKFVAERLAMIESTSASRRQRLSQAQRLVNGLLVSRLIKVDEEAKKPSRDWFVMTDAGKSLRAARATKPLKRDRADKAVAQLLEIAQRINRDPIFLHDVA